LIYLWKTPPLWGVFLFVLLSWWPYRTMRKWYYLLHSILNISCVGSYSCQKYTWQNRIISMMEKMHIVVIAKHMFYIKATCPDILFCRSDFIWLIATALSCNNLSFCDNHWWINNALMLSIFESTTNCSIIA
jgi:hypothetical protein